MYQNMFNPYSPQNSVDKLKKQRDEIDNLISSYQQQMPPQQPVNNFINTNQPQISSADMVEWRVLNENEQVDNLYVNNKTLFINDKNMIVKDVNGSLEKWKVEKVYPIDPKDERISQLEKEIENLKGMINNEHTKSVEPIVSEQQSHVDVDRDVKSKPKTIVK